MEEGWDCGWARRMATSYEPYPAGLSRMAMC